MGWFTPNVIFALRVYGRCRSQTGPAPGPRLQAGRPDHDWGRKHGQEDWSPSGYSQG